MTSATARKVGARTTPPVRQAGPGRVGTSPRRQAQVQPNPQSPIVYGMPFDDYLLRPEEHSSAVKVLALKGALAYRHYKQGTPDTDAKRVGRACHTATFEPDDFLRRYALWEGGVRRSEKWNEFQAMHAGKTILTDKQYEQALRVRDAVRKHSAVRRYLDEPDGKPEVSIFWTHQRTGIRFKIRPDWLCSVMPDLKTTGQIAPRDFQRTAMNMGYIIQLAIYADGLIASGIGKRRVKMFAAESKPPWDVVVWDIPEEALIEGRKKYEAALDLLLKCEKRNEWPGIAPDQELTFVVPDWFGDQAGSESELTFDGQTL